MITIAGEGLHNSGLGSLSREASSSGTSFSVSSAQVICPLRTGTHSIPDSQGDFSQKVNGKYACYEVSSRIQCTLPLSAQNHYTCIIKCVISWVNQHKSAPFCTRIEIKRISLN
jgi:hypothetical protein